jgi:hypothetical protein
MSVFAFLSQMRCRHDYRHDHFGEDIVGRPFVNYRYPAEWFVCSKCQRKCARSTIHSVLWGAGLGDDDLIFSGRFNKPGSLGRGDPGALVGRRA